MKVPFLNSGDSKSKGRSLDIIGLTYIAGFKYVPETKGKSLEEIEKLWRKK